MENKALNNLQTALRSLGTFDGNVTDDQEVIDMLIDYLKRKKASIASMAEQKQEDLTKVQTCLEEARAYIDDYKHQLCNQYGHLFHANVSDTVDLHIHTPYGNRYAYTREEKCVYCGKVKFSSGESCSPWFYTPRAITEKEALARRELQNLETQYENLSKQYSKLEGSFEFNKWFESFMSEISILPRWIENLEKDENDDN